VLIAYLLFVIFK